MTIVALPKDLMIAVPKADLFDHQLVVATELMIRANEQ